MFNIWVTILRWYSVLSSVHDLLHIFSRSKTSQKQSPGGLLWKRCSYRFRKITQHLCYSLIFNKVADLRSATLLRKKLWHRCFPVNFAKFTKMPFLRKHLWWLLLTSVLASFHPLKLRVINKTQKMFQKQSSRGVLYVK